MWQKLLEDNTSINYSDNLLLKDFKYGFISKKMNKWKGIWNHVEFGNGDKKILKVKKMFMSRIDQ